MFRDCPNDIVCNFCSEAGHKERDCERYKASQTYVAYAGDIVEGRAADFDISTVDASHEEPFDHLRRNLHTDILGEMTHDENINTELHIENTLSDNLTSGDKTDQDTFCEAEQTDSTKTDNVDPASKQTTETTLERLSRKKGFLSHR